MSLKNVCLDYGCIKCCINTEMFLLRDDINRIIILGFKEDFFSRDFNGFKSLKNNDGRCVFHDGKKCTIYSSRPLGCKLYPVIFDEILKRPILDEFCPHDEKFFLSFKLKRELSRVYNLLINERKK